MKEAEKNTVPRMNQIICCYSAKKKKERGGRKKQEKRLVGILDVSTSSYTFSSGGILIIPL